MGTSDEISGEHGPARTSIFQPFRLLDLPLEIQQNIYDQYCSVFDVEVRMIPARSELGTPMRNHMRIVGVPGLKTLDMVCRSMLEGIRVARARCYNGTIKAHDHYFDVFAVPPQPIRDLIPTSMQWLAEKTTRLVPRANTMNMDYDDAAEVDELKRTWVFITDAFPNLKEIHFCGAIKRPISCDLLEAEEWILSEIQDFDEGVIDKDMVKFWYDDCLQGFVRCLEQTGRRCKIYQTAEERQVLPLGYVWKKVCYRYCYRGIN